ncbi:MAG: glycosyl transferase family protein [Acidobacteriaceae bacterium]|nr:glycosyl transferase family protein [Acidobacteriaceae bacterium]
MFLLADATHAFTGVWTLSAAWPWILGSLAVILLLSGIDDLVPVIICAIAWLRRRKLPAFCNPNLAEKHERMIAIFVPCWKEADVIGNMVRHNLAAIRYRNFDLFLGVYPNDRPTVEVAEALSDTFLNVHVAPCPHPGPTSKADCLNWIYQCMLVWEKIRGVRFDTVVLHDAEDLIHPDALVLINAKRANYAMVQVPVLPLPTPWIDFTHGIYCDEFAEYQTIDMPARQFSGSFIPSNGVGTGFAREILERLAGERENCIFDPASLTEDYETGVYIHQAGYSQLFAPLRRDEQDFLATREYFPRTTSSAIRQRTRWVMGIALQGWERDGWRGSWRTRYWFWRDRKGLVTNPLSLFTNVLFIAGLLDWIGATLVHRPWAFAVSSPMIVMFCWMTLSLQCLRMMLRACCVARLFGTRFACGVPLRVFHANFINSFASFGAMWRFAEARLQRRPLVWLKTEHAYPLHAVLQLQRRELSEALVSSAVMSEEQLATVRAEMPPETDLAEFLLSHSLVSEEDLCRAISLQCGLPAARVDVQGVRSRVVRTLPAHVQRRFGVVPYRVHGGRLHVAGMRAPSSGLFEELKSFTRMPIDFQLVTRENYKKLQDLL